MVKKLSERLFNSFIVDIIDEVERCFLEKTARFSETLKTNVVILN